jgi:hypothetical protein
MWGAGGNTSWQEMQNAAFNMSQSGSFGMMQPNSPMFGMGQNQMMGQRQMMGAGQNQMIAQNNMMGMGHNQMMGMGQNQMLGMGQKQMMGMGQNQVMGMGQKQMMGQNQLTGMGQGSGVGMMQTRPSMGQEDCTDQAGKKPGDRTNSQMLGGGGSIGGGQSTWNNANASTQVPFVSEIQFVCYRYLLNSNMIFIWLALLFFKIIITNTPANIATLQAHQVHTISQLFDTHLSGGLPS